MIRRTLLQIIREEDVTPSYVLPNGETAGYYAHEYLLSYNQARNTQKKRERRKKKEKISRVNVG